MSRFYVDIETRSRTDISAGAYRYVEDPDFAILMMAYAWDDDDPVRVTTDPEEMRAVLLSADPDAGRGTPVAHNSTFERVCFSRLLGLRHYWSAALWDDTMPRAALAGLPLQLDKLARALGGEQKDAAGKRLINLFSKPQRNGSFVAPEDRPEEWEKFKAYCAQDVETLRSVDRALPGWPTKMERAVWEADQRINDRGVKFDAPLARAAVGAAEDNAFSQELRFTQLTGVGKPGSLVKVRAWLASRGVTLPDLREATVSAALKGDLPDDVREALELRQELALTAAKKFQAGLDGVCSDGRLRGSFRYGGAHTGRWAGSGLQPQNLPRATLKDPEETERLMAEAESRGLLEGLDSPALKAVRERCEERARARREALAIGDLMMGDGADAGTLKALVRASILGPLTVVDYSAIEARVVAWLAGEEWSLEAFRQGRDIYVETASRLGPNFTRQDGKVTVLALGYGGGPGALRVMGAKGSDDELGLLVDAWRKANPNVVRLWRDLGRAFARGGKAGERLTVGERGDARAIVLPSGRELVYHGCRFGGRASFWDHRRGHRQDTYGGRLTENVTQAVARDVLAEALVRLEAEGYPVVGHVHDEVLVDGVFDIKEIAATMSATPAWAEGLPLNGEGFTCQRYRKG